MDTTQTSRAGFSFTEIMVVMTLTLLIVMLFMPPLMSSSDRGARRANCANNQRQIVLAMALYANDHDQKWPVKPAGLLGRWVPLEGRLGQPLDEPLFDPTATAISSLEFLSYATGGDLSAKGFACPNKPSARPLTSAENTGSTTVTSAWASNGPSQIGYAYDWSIPPDAPSVRVVTADRDQQAHKGSVVMAAFADAHVANINRIGVSFINRDANNDDMYSAVGDGPMNTPGEGSTTRAFVR